MMGPEFWRMGGYARFVWPCVGLALGVLGWNLWSARRLQARALRFAERSLVMARTDASQRAADLTGRLEAAVRGDEASARGAGLARNESLARSERS